MTTASKNVQYYLGKLTPHGGIASLSDGPHDEAQGAHEAYYLHQRLGLLQKGVRYAVVKCELFTPVPDSSNVNEGALSTLNSIGLSPARKSK